MSKKKILFIHLLNNFSGSPNVLAAVVEELTKKGFNTTVLSSFNNQGFLSEITCTNKININYTFRKNILFRLFQLIRFQILAAIEVLKQPKDEIIYINTILPFLPAIFAKFRGMKVVYHIHEAYPRKNIFQTFCFWCAEIFGDKIFCVSMYVKGSLSRGGKEKVVVIYNALNQNFVVNKMIKNVSERSNILMISSLKEYKGIFEFCKLPRTLQQYTFTLVCDASKEELEKLFPADYFNYENLVILPTQNNLHPFYHQADIILNLSNPKFIIETFGLTILEGMSYGLPVIVPPVGGITELVGEGKNGLQIDVNDFEKLKTGVISILENEKLYQEMSKEALKKSKEFSLNNQINTISDELSKF